MSIVGRTYLLAGEPVTILIQWGLKKDGYPPNSCPKNVMIEFADGSRTIRPFRGLRRAA